MENKQFAIVGSRCGGYNFYTMFNNRLLWLGPRNDSDMDIFCNVQLLNSKFKIDRINSLDFFLKNRLQNGLHIFRNIERPYQINGTLHLPKDLTFLCIAIRKKIGRIKKNHFCNFNPYYEIFDKNKKHITTLEYKCIF